MSASHANAPHQDWAARCKKQDLDCFGPDHCNCDPYVTGCRCAPDDDFPCPESTINHEKHCNVWTRHHAAVAARIAEG